MRGHPAVNGVGELEIIFSESFDERCSVNSRRGAKRVMAQEGMVRRNRGMGSLSHFFAILLKPREILLNEAHEAKIDEHQFHGGVANAFTEGICGGVNLVCAASHSRKRIRDRKPAIVVAAPVGAIFFAGWFHDLVCGELAKVERTIWRGCADGVARSNGAR